MNGTFAPPAEGFAWTIWSDPLTSENTDPCAVRGGHVPCTRHFVHKYKDWILGLDTVTKVKVSLYENGEEAAWAIFRKLPESDDTWFQPSRVIDSFPWDVELIRSEGQMSLQPEAPNDATGFYIRSDPGYPAPDQDNPIRYWMKIREARNNCFYGHNHGRPFILYSKGPRSTLLSPSGATRVHDWDGPLRLNWTQAEHYCETNLGVPLISWEELDAVRVEENYECCTLGWTTNTLAGYPMNHVNPGCGNRTGMIGPIHDPAAIVNVYCKPDQSLVGLADTMVISVNV